MPNGPKANRRRVRTNVLGVSANSLWVIGWVELSGSSALTVRGSVASAMPPSLAAPNGGVQVTSPNFLDAWGLALRAVPVNQIQVLTEAGPRLSVTGIQVNDADSFRLDLDGYLDAGYFPRLLVRSFEPLLALPNGMQCAGADFKFPS